MEQGDQSVQRWELPGADEQTIFGNTHLPASEPAGALLICHGFKGYKDYGVFPALARAAAQRGLVAHRFNFSHSGMTERTDTFERPDLFERDTWGRQIQDLLMVAEACRDGRLPGGEQAMQVWFGHSRGGVTALLAASRSLHTAGAAQPAGVVTAAAPCFSAALSDAEKQRLREQGHLESPSARTGQTLRIGREWLDEIEAEPAAFDPIEAIARLERPVLVVHGEADDTVPADAGHALAEAAGPRARLALIEGASHTFNCPNPLEEDQPLPEATERLIDMTCDFARQCLAQ